MIEVFNAANMGRQSMKVAEIRRPSRNVAKRGRFWRSPRYNMTTTITHINFFSSFSLSFNIFKAEIPLY